MANASWFNIVAAKGDKSPPVIYLYDQIGAFGVTAKDFAAELRALGDLKGKKLTVRINSPGGDVFQGTAIYNLLRDTGADITVFIDGLAASMASMIAMAGNRVVIADNAQMMIHNPSAFTVGESDDMKAMATLLDSLKAGMVTAYASKSGQGREAISKIMDEETWMDATQAVAEGFADEVGGALQVAAFDLSRFKRPPSPEAAHNTEVTTMTKEEMDALTAGIVGGIAAALKPAVAEAKPDTVAAPKSEADIKTALKAEMKAYSDEVTSLCALAGLPGEAAAFIAAETPVAEVRAKLVAKQAEARNTTTTRGNLPSNHSTMGSLVDNKDEDISDLVPKPEAYGQTWDRFNGRRAAGARH